MVIPLGTIRSGCVRMDGYTRHRGKGRYGDVVLEVSSGPMCVAQPQVRCVWSGPCVHKARARREDVASHTSR